MILEDRPPAKASGVQSHSSSVQSTPEKNGHLYDALTNSELLQELLRSGPKRELPCTYIDSERKLNFCVEGKMKEQQLKTGNRCSKNPETRKAKQNRKTENPTRVTNTTKQASDLRYSTPWVCKNSACRAVLSIDDAFCRRCSCCICHQFDDNKDPTLWLVCESESVQGESCGLSCHIECAFRWKKVGVVNLGQYMHLDGSYCCASCGKVSGILGCWKKQLNIAKDARRVDVLCYRIFLSYRLLNGTLRFNELHEIAAGAKAKLESEVGPINGDSVKMARGIVSRLAIASDVQKLCSQGIQKADEWLAALSTGNPDRRVDSLPAACRFLFEEVTSSSVVIVLIELPIELNDSIIGYKLWYCKSRDGTPSKEPPSKFPREKRRIVINGLEPCTEYTFRIASYTEAGDLGHSEAKCFTKSVEIIRKNLSSMAVVSCKKEYPSVEGSSSSAKDDSTANMAGYSAGFKVRDLGKILHLACLEGFCSADVDKCCGGCKPCKHEPKEDFRSPPVSRELDLNVVSVPDLNEDATPPVESSRDDQASGPSDHWALVLNQEAPAVDSQAGMQRKRSCNTNGETHDCDSTLIDGSPIRVLPGPGSLDENFEYCVKIIRWLECKGYLKQDFRLKLLTWFSLRSTDQERRVVNTFIQALLDDPKSLAAQLVDSFSDIISSKRPRNGLTSKFHGTELGLISVLVPKVSPNSYFGP